MPSRKRLPVDQIVREYRAGESAVELARRFGVSDSTIRSRLDERAVRIRGIKEALNTDVVQKRLSARTGCVPWNRGLTAENDERMAALSLTLQGKEITEEQLRAMLSAQGFGKKTRPEKQAHDLLRFMFSPYEIYEYTGCGGQILRFADGRLKVPDFVHAFHNKAIEVFGRYWHDEEEVEPLIGSYAEIGWGCLVLWEDEIAGANDIIMEFTYPEIYRSELAEINRVA